MDIDRALCLVHSHLLTDCELRPQFHERITSATLLTPMNSQGYHMYNFGQFLVTFNWKAVLSVSIAWTVHGHLQVIA
jgi:hypothetical protein